MSNDRTTATAPILTSDNLPLSWVTAVGDPRAVDCTLALPEAVASYIRRSLADNTKRAYASDIRQFEAEGGSLPATDVAVATYIAAQASRLKVSTLVRRLASLSKVHDLCGWHNPVRSPLVRSTLHGIRRVHRTARRQARPLLTEDLSLVINSMNDTLRDARDRTLLLTGFAGGFRRSELVSLDIDDLTQVSEGVFVNLRRSKTDQVGAGRSIAIPFGPVAMCPVTALTTWLARSQITSGAVFRRISRHGQIGERLSGEAVCSILRARLENAGLNPQGYSGHSLRAGFVTSATMRDVASEKIRNQTGHASDSAMNMYVRNMACWDDNAATVALRPQQSTDG